MYTVSTSLTPTYVHILYTLSFEWCKNSESIFMETAMPMRIQKYEYNIMYRRLERHTTKLILSLHCFNNFCNTLYWTSHLHMYVVYSSHASAIIPCEVNTPRAKEGCRDRAMLVACHHFLPYLSLSVGNVIPTSWFTLHVCYMHICVYLYALLDM